MVVFWHQFLGAVLTPFVLSIGACLVMIKVAGRVGLLDYPTLERKAHQVATPVVGGIAVAVAAFATHALLVPGPMPLGLLCGAAILLLTGILDDKLDLSWRMRFAAQAFAALPMIMIDGVRIDSLGSLIGADPLILGPFAAPFTIFAVLATINALNMVDGADGLAGMLTLCTLSMIAAAAFYIGDRSLTYVLAPFLAALAGFLALNLRNPWMKRARLFLGNSGSEFLGFLIVWSAVRLTQQTADGPSEAPPVLMLWFFAVPLVDCLALMISRGVSGRSPFSADRNHLHHRLMRIGLSTTGMVFVMSAAAIILGTGAAAAALQGVSEQALFAVFMAYLGAFVAMSHGASRLRAARHAMDAHQVEGSQTRA